MFNLAAAVLVYSVLILCISGQHYTPIVNIQELGYVQGSIGYTAWTNRTIYQFHSIPYANPPTGVFRFKPVTKVTSWIGTLDASKPKTVCPQISYHATNDANEDCLTLSVFSNNLDTTRPVMVYIHGGWFFAGGADTISPGYLLESNIVLVVIQYRLGPLGFMSMLSENIPGNVGILDMILALEWVQSHIRYFGGDNKQVTIFGESAGAAGVSALLHTPLTQNRPTALFHRAILQSGSVFSPWAMCDTPLEGALDIAKRAGCNGTAVEECLQQVSVKTLLEAFGDHRDDTVIARGYPYVAGTTVVVGDPTGLFPKHPSHYLWNASSSVSIMAGATAQDGAFLLDEIYYYQPELITSLHSSHDLLRLIRTLNEKLVLSRTSGGMEGYEVLQSFSIEEVDHVPKDNVIYSAVDICSNHGIKGPVLVDVHAFSRVNPENTYLYSFDYPTSTPTYSTFPFPMEKAVHHAEDLFYLFPSIALNAADTKMAKLMVQLWTSFASTGIPTAKDQPYWPPANRLYGPYLKINVPCQQGKYYLDEFSSTAAKYKVPNSGCNQRGWTATVILLVILVLKVY